MAWSYRKNVYQRVEQSRFFSWKNCLHNCLQDGVLGGNSYRRYLREVVTADLEVRLAKTEEPYERHTILEALIDIQKEEKLYPVDVEAWKKEKKSIEQKHARKKRKFFDSNDHPDDHF